MAVPGDGEENFGEIEAVTGQQGVGRGEGNLKAFRSSDDHFHLTHMSGLVITFAGP